MSDRDEQDQAEAFDDSKLGEEQPDPDARLEADDYPPDVLLGADRYGITPQEERIDEPIGENDARYEPDPLVEALDAEADDPNRPPDH